MKVNLIVMQHSRGLRRDGEVLEEALSRLPLSVVESGVGYPQPSVADIANEAWRIGLGWLNKFDVNIHIEDVKLRWIKTARMNWWIPNQEWIRIPLNQIGSGVDLVLCKTRLCERVFASQGWPTRFIGFSTEDRFNPQVPREGRALHVAGQSPNKGTIEVIEAWRRHPEWPTLDLVWKSPPGAEESLPHNVTLHRSPVSDQALSLLQNRALFHICPSGVEGFGHTLVEAMSCGACVVTTDAPPMNELVGTDRGVLVPWGTKRDIGLGEYYRVSVDALCTSVQSLLDLPSDERREMGERARQWHIDNHKSFQARIRGLFEEQF